MHFVMYLPILYRDKQTFNEGGSCEQYSNSQVRILIFVFPVSPFARVVDSAVHTRVSKKRGGRHHGEEVR